LKVGQSLIGEFADDLAAATETRISKDLLKHDLQHEESDTNNCKDCSDGEPSFSRGTQFSFGFEIISEADGQENHSEAYKNRAQRRQRVLHRINVRHCALSS
jgi:hypothetical protein